MHFIGGCTCISYDQVSCFVRWFSLLKTIFAALLNISKIAKVRKYKCSKNAVKSRIYDYLVLESNFTYLYIYIVVYLIFIYHIQICW
jgi:hypothetical protein